MNLPNELTQQVHGHLAEVRKYLGKLPADERQEILQSIESHIYDALENRSDGAPTPALLDAVIAEMDPPESYGELPVETVASPRHGLLKSIGRGYSLKLILIALIVTVYLVLNDFNKPVPSKTEASVVGHWTSVDIIPGVKQFNPQSRNWTGALEMKELTFLAEGKTDRPFWTWKDGVLHHSGDNTDAKFLIKNISGDDYLFLEWMSGDVIHKGQPPKYYVFKKQN